MLGDLGIPNYLDLVQRVDSRAKCDAFLQSTGFNFDGLIEMLNYLFRWVLPFKCPIRELVDTDDERGRTYLETFMKVYYRTIGKDFSDFKAAIPLDWMIRGARVLPRIIEE